MMTENNNHQVRNKFNTLTPAEARKLNKFINYNRQPIRTASVLNKPRPPPIIVANLRGLDNSEQQSQNGGSVLCEEELQLSRTNSIRSASVCTAADTRRDRRHSINYGAAVRANTLNSRLSLYSTNSVHSSHQIQHPGQHATSHIESISNLSYKSSQDIPDSAYHSANSARLQTMSVDLGSSAHTFRPSFQRQQSMFTNRSVRLQKSNTIARTSGAVEPCCLMDKYKNFSQKVSDDSYVSAKSDISAMDVTLRPGCEAPQRQLSNLSNNSKRSSVSKNSLSSSTYKVFQSPFANIKRFFRNNIPKQFNASAGNDGGDEGISANEKSTNTGISNDSFKSSLSKNMSELSLSADSSSIFNRSQTPPVCPPPPGELKSMCYMGSSINYSNYDEFTRSRNERLGGWPQSDGMAEDMFQRQTSSVLPRLPSQPPPVHRLNSLQPNGSTHVTQQQHPSPSRSERDDRQDSWQLASLPVSFERNLATVFEEQKQQQTQNINSQIAYEHCSYMSSYQAHQQQSFDTATYANGQLQQQLRKNNLIKPPLSFDDDDRRRDARKLKTADDVALALTSNNSKSSSNQSLASTTTTDSILDYQRQQQQVPASPYRFSFAQPLSPPAPIVNISNPRNDGLPPRVPSSNIDSHHQRTASALTDSSNSGGSTNDTKQICDNNSSSGNSSNCSSQLNVINNCDKLNSLESSDKTSYSDESSGHNGLSGGNLNGLENDIDTTILSETSTLQGDATGASFYMNKCAELERAVASLKNKLISREKELTDLQLSQLQNDYTIDKLKSQVNKLEKENGQLKSILSNIQGRGQPTAKNSIPKFVRS